MNFRKTLFWLHLISGVVAGLVILVMSFTGTVLAFEQELVAWSERDARRVVVPAGAERLSLDELQRRVREAQPEARPASVTVSADPAAAVVFSMGRDEALYVDPYTGEIRKPKSTAMHDFMHVMEDWHRTLAMSGDNRVVGRAITGACNAAFVFLAVSGLYLWFPRKWLWTALRPSLWFTGASGKARDWNWHNVFGFWALIPITVMAVTGMVLSYRWASNLVYRIAGEEPPTQQGPMAPGSGPAVQISRPTPDSRPLGLQAMLVAAQTSRPDWEQISLRTGTAQRGPGGRGQPGGAPVGGNAGGEQRRREGGEGGAAAGAARPAGENRGGEARAGGSGPQPVTATVRTPDRWPRTASTTLQINPFTAEVLRTEGFSDQTPGRQARMWMRFLHTGQALGWVGQLIGALGCIAGCVLVYTGFALSWRRFFKRKTKTTAATEAKATVAA